MAFTRLLIDARRFLSNFMEIDQLKLHEREAWTKTFQQQLVHEAGEVLDEINWKHHKKTRKDVDRTKLLFELVDVLKFWMNIAAVWGFTANELQDAWDTKTRLVEARYKKEVESADGDEAVV